MSEATKERKELTQPTGSAFSVGQDVSWRYVPRGGWGIPVFVPARIVKINPKTVRIAAKRKDGEWEERNVKAESLRLYSQNTED